MKIKQITETTTAGVIATVNSPLGGTQSRGNPSIYGGKKVGTLFKGKKTSAPYANSINESAELSEAHLEEDDIIVVPGQGRKSKTGFVPHGQSRVDHEVEMARSDLFSAAKNAQQVYSMIKDISEDEGLDGWVQEKIIKANDYLNTVREYLEGKQVQGVDEADMSRRGFLKGLGAAAVAGAAGSLATKANAQSAQNIPALIDKIKVSMSNNMIDPESAKYRDIKVYDTADRSGNPVWLFTGQFDSKNKMGGYTGYQGFFVAVNQSTSLPIAMDFEGKNPLQAGFVQGKYKRAIESGKLVYDNGQLVQEESFNQGVTENNQRGDSLVTDALKIMRGAEVSDAVRALKTVLGDREYNSRRGFYNFYVRQIIDMYGQQGLAEGAKVDRMVKHVAQSEKKLGKSKDEAENIAWATANKRGMLDNKNKKA